MHEFLESAAKNPSALVSVVVGACSLFGVLGTWLFSAGIFWKTFQVVNAKLDSLAQSVEEQSEKLNDHGATLRVINERCQSHEAWINKIEDRVERGKV